MKVKYIKQSVLSQRYFLKFFDLDTLGTYLFLEGSDWLPGRLQANMQKGNVDGNAGNYGCEWLLMSVDLPRASGLIGKETDERRTSNKA